MFEVFFIDVINVVGWMSMFSDFLQSSVAGKLWYFIQLFSYKIWIDLGKMWMSISVILLMFVVASHQGF